jgi:hypothetical protein
MRSRLCEISSAACFSRVVLSIRVDMDITASSLDHI